MTTREIKARAAAIGGNAWENREGDSLAAQLYWTANRLIDGTDAGDMAANRGELRQLAELSENVEQE